MKLTVKTLKGRHFEIRVQPSDTIMAVKKKIEDLQGKDSYPCGQQLLIHNGKVLKDESTLTENTISEDAFLVVMLSKSKASGSSTTSSGPAASSVAPSTVSTPAPETPSAPAPESVVAASNPATVSTPSNTYGEAASTLVAPTNLEQTVQHILDMGGGMWNKETVERALRAAYNNPERAVDYLYSGIPVMAEVAVPVAQTGIDSSTNLNPPPLNLFPQDNVPGDAVAGQGPLDFLRTNPQFQALRAMVHSDPEILQPMLQELGQENPELLRVIQEHHQEFLQLINEPVAEGLEGLEGDMVETDDLDLPHAISVTPEDEAIIERLEAMGFARELVVEAFLACDRNEELAINYLLENSRDFED